MRLYVIIFLFVTSFNYAQSNSTAPTDDAEIALSTATVEKSPEFPGGKTAFYKYVARNFQMPDVEDFKGRIMVAFIIEKDGSVSNVKVLQDLGHGTTEEAIRVFTNSPKWIPGEQNGKKVRVMYTLPISLNTAG